MNVIVTEVVRDEGTVVLFRAHDEGGNKLTFAADHRSAADIAEALVRGELPLCWIEDWQVVSYR